MKTRIDAADVVDRVRSLPALPQVWHELDRALHSDTASPEQIVRLVSRDQGLTAVALKLANSPFYGVSRRAVSLRDAVQILGLQTLSAATMTAAVMSRFDPELCAGFDIEDSWRHALGTALGAQALAEPRGIDPCHAYTAGLLHDVGKLALATHFAMPYEATLAWATKHDVPALEAERELLGIDHAEVGQLIATHWRLAPVIADAIGSHHQVTSDGGTPTLRDVLHLADNIVHALDISQAEHALVPPLSLAAWSRVAPPPDELQRVFTLIDARARDIDLAVFA